MTLIISGYGAVVPKTNPGKILTMFLALILIPIATITIMFIGKCLMSSFRYFVVSVEQRFLKRERVVWLTRKVVYALKSY